MSLAMLTIGASDPDCFKYLKGQGKVDLMNLLCASIYGFCINGIKACCPTVADDMALLALSRSGIE